MMKTLKNAGLGLATLLATSLITSCSQDSSGNSPAVVDSPTVEVTEPPAPRESTLARIQVTERGLYQVTAFDLQNAGVDLTGLNPDDLAITHLGKPQAVEVQDLDGNGQFNATDRVVFFGQPMRGDTTYRYKYAQENSYLLHNDFSLRPSGDEERDPSLGFTPGEIVAELASPDAMPVSLQRSFHFEEDHYWSDRFAQREVGATDFSFYTQLDFLRRESTSVNFDLAGIDTEAEEPVTLVIEMFGRSNASRNATARDHSVEVKLNGQVVGTMEWDGPNPHRAFIEGIDPALLDAVDNRLTLSLVQREDVPIDVVLFDWVHLLYPVHPVVEDNRGEFALTGSSADTRVEIKGFNSPNTHVFSLTNQQVIDAEVIEDLMGGVSVAFRAPVDNGLYAVATDDELLTPLAVERFAPAIHEDVANEQNQFLIITHSLFQNASDRLAEHRRTEDGLTVKVVTIQDVYDRYNYGIPHPDAIKRCLQDIHEHGGDPALRYVLLMGDATWDWHGLSQPTVTYIPTQYVFGADVEYAADNVFVIFERAGRPQLALGRLPVGSVEEAEGVVDKIIAYDEAIQADDHWRSNIVFAASDKPMYRDHLDKAVENYVEGNFDLTRLYATNDSPLDCTQRLIDSFNEGAAFVSYVGHGARYVWQTGTTLVQRAADYETNFNPDRIDELHNSPMLPIVFGITCFTNNFDNPDPRDCIGEKLVLRPEGGAIASIATSSYSFVHSDMIFCDQLFESMFNHPEINRVGDLLLTAFQSQQTPQQVCKMFLLLGDPTARIPLMPLESATASAAGGAE